MCSPCPDPLWNIIRIIATLLFTIVLIVLMIKSTMAGAVEKKNVTSIFMKILMNHMQLITLTASFNFSWPEQVLAFFSAVKPASSASTQVLSVDCFLGSKSNSTTPDESGMRVFWQKMIMYALMPFLLALVSYIVWWVHSAYKKYEMPYGKTISTLVILLFLVHPNIVEYMFNGFYCIDIDGEPRIREDLRVVCWQTEHKLYGFMLALPSIVVWGLGIPFFAFTLLTRERETLDKLATKEKFGFLYNGYKKDFYYLGNCHHVQEDCYHLHCRLYFLKRSCYTSSYCVFAFDHLHRHQLEKGTFHDCRAQRFGDAVYGYFNGHSLLRPLLHLQYPTKVY